MSNEQAQEKLERLFTIEEASNWLGVSTSYIRNKIETGEIEYAFKISADKGWRIPESSLKRFTMNLRERKRPSREN